MRILENFYQNKQHNKKIGVVAVYCHGSSGDVPLIAPLWNHANSFAFGSGSRAQLNLVVMFI